MSGATAYPAQSKLDCALRVRGDRTHSRGLAHLFVQPYHERIGFWYGVAQLPTGDSSVARRLDLNEAPGQLIIDFADGRTGVAEVTELFYSEDNIELAFAGVSRLTQRVDAPATDGQRPNVAR